MTHIRRFRKKPIIVEAEQFTETNGQEIAQWILSEEGDCECIGENKEKIEIYTLEGVMTAYPGDWIIRGIEDEFYPCKNAIFQATYEEIGS